MSTKIVWTLLICGIAVLSTLTGAAALIDFGTAPGLVPQAPAVWPRNSRVPRERNRSQIVVIAHPQCECTQATLEELRSISGAGVAVLVFRPDRKSSWRKERVWEQAEKISGAAVSWDDAGAEAKVFGSSTSGSVLLYGPSGNLLFHGGVTQSRGHTGSNRGLSRLKAALRTGTPDVLASPVFGCSLLNSGSRT